MKPEDQWLTDYDRAHGSALSVSITRKLHEEQSPFQKIAVYESTHFGNILVIDDIFMLSARENFIYHEMLAHPVLFTHPNPRRVAIVGGGDCGTLREVLKHSSVEHVIQIDIDERVTRVSEQFFPELCDANHDPRAHLHFEDAIKWMADAPDNDRDVIIIDSTDPIGPGEGLFTEAFYHNCRRVLGSDGLIALQSESPLFYGDLQKKIHDWLRNTGFDHVQLLPFPQCIYPSGWFSMTMAGVIDLTQFRYEDARNRSFDTRYYHADLHRAAQVLPIFVHESLYGTKP